jgi:hypothetical protein
LVMRHESSWLTRKRAALLWWLALVVTVFICSAWVRGGDRRAAVA